MITVNRFDSNLNQRAFGREANVTDEVGTIEKVIAAHDSARAGGLTSTIYVVLDSRPWARTRVTGLTNQMARHLNGMKEGQRIRVKGHLQQLGYIIAESVELVPAATEGIQEL